MKRDWELVRKILIAIEESADDEPASIEQVLKDIDPLYLSLHVRLLHEAGLIHAVQHRTFNRNESWLPHSLTWRGHDFLDAIKGDDTWSHILERMRAAKKDLPTELIYDLALRNLASRVAPSAGPDPQPPRTNNPAPRETAA